MIVLREPLAFRGFCFRGESRRPRRRRNHGEPRSVRRDWSRNRTPRRVKKATGGQDECREEPGLHHAGPAIVKVRIEVTNACGSENEIPEIRKKIGRQRIESSWTHEEGPSGISLKEISYPEGRYQVHLYVRSQPVYKNAGDKAADALAVRRETHLLPAKLSAGNAGAKIVEEEKRTYLRRAAGLCAQEQDAENRNAKEAAEQAELVTNEGTQTG
jgi:hypothetical protein